MSEKKKEKTIFISRIVRNFFPVMRRLICIHLPGLLALEKFT